jgi:hypothetical protein
MGERARRHIATFTDKPLDGMRRSGKWEIDFCPVYVISFVRRPLIGVMNTAGCYFKMHSRSSDASERQLLADRWCRSRSFLSFVTLDKGYRYPDDEVVTSIASPLQVIKRPCGRNCNILCEKHCHRDQVTFFGSRIPPQNFPLLALALISASPHSRTFAGTNGSDT